MCLAFHPTGFQDGGRRIVGLFDPCFIPVNIWSMKGLTRYYSLVLLFIAMIGLVTTDNRWSCIFSGDSRYSSIPDGLNCKIRTREGRVKSHHHQTRCALLTDLVLYVSTGSFNIFAIINAAPLQIPGSCPGLGGRILMEQRAIRPGAPACLAARCHGYAYLDQSPSMPPPWLMPALCHHPHLSCSWLPADHSRNLGGAITACWRPPWRFTPTT